MKAVTWVALILSVIIALIWMVSTFLVNPGDALLASQLFFFAVLALIVVWVLYGIFWIVRRWI